MTGVLYIGGEQPDYAYAQTYIPAGALTVAADSGADYAAEHHLPLSCIIGDMDSITSQSMFLSVPTISLPQNKDFTDTENGLAYLKEQGCTDFTILGGGGGRVDHLLQLRELFSARRRICTDWKHIEIPQPNIWVTDSSCVFLIREGETLDVELPPDITAADFPVSVFPCPAYHMYRCESDGLVWPLDAVDWTEYATSISNCIDGASCHITVRKGAFLCIFPLVRKDTVTVKRTV